ncbi:MAG: glycosyltransferase family 2 protein [Xenococcaceae cyanobacterium]
MNCFVKEPVYIIIPVHNRKNITLQCLENLARNQDLQHYHIVVVDDGSTDGTTEAIEHLYPEVTVLKGDGNLWWTGAIALGMKYAYEREAEYLIWLNDDCQFDNNTISNLVSFSRENNDVIVGCQGFDLENRQVIAFGGKIKTWQGYRFTHAHTNTITPCDLVSGNIVCIPRLIIDRIDYPNHKITPHYGGDSLYLILAKKAGFQIFVDARNQVFSLPGESSLYPKAWLLEPGEPLKIFKLIFTPQSGLSWQVCLRLNWEAYHFWGLIMFLKKYLSIISITLLRFLPLFLRHKISSLI